MNDVIAAHPVARIPVQRDGIAAHSSFPVRRIYCVGRNFAGHAREMGAQVTQEAQRGRPIFFLKPTDAIVTDGIVPYPPSTQDLQHEVELVVALGRNAPVGIVPSADAMALVYGVGVGLDLTRRDLQSQAKAGGLPWDIGKSFDYCAPVSALVPIAEAGNLAERTLTLLVNGERRQLGALSDLIWDVPEILHELSLLYTLRAGDLVFMGTPAGVGPLHVGDRFDARLDGVVELRGQITAAMAPV